MVISYGFVGAPSSRVFGGYPLLPVVLLSLSATMRRIRGRTKPNGRGRKHTLIPQFPNLSSLNLLRAQRDDQVRVARSAIGPMAPYFFYFHRLATNSRLPHVANHRSLLVGRATGLAPSFGPHSGRSEGPCPLRLSPVRAAVLQSPGAGLEQQ